MTFSLLAYEKQTGKWGGIAATGSLCVGGWVLRGRAGAGVSASQGHAPSTLWGEQVLDLMEQGQSANTAVKNLIDADQGCAWRQLTAIDPLGNCAGHTGASNTDFKNHIAGSAVIASGNILAGHQVLDAMLDAYQNAKGLLEDRLLEALRAGEGVGGDSRGVNSAAMLVVQHEAPPLNLRIDWHEAPISALQSLLERTRDADYREWLTKVPSRSDPFRFPDNLG